MSNVTVDGDRLWHSLMTVAEIGGTPTGGIKRLTLTDEDRRVRDWFAAACADVGCTVTVDALGRGGISHNEEEVTTQDQCAVGAAVLLESVLAFDGLLQSRLEAI